MQPRSAPDTARAAAADESSAGETRRRLRERGIVPIDPDERIGVMLCPGEGVVAVRRGALVERRKDVCDAGRALVGDLYVTTTRILCLGQVRIEVPLEEISDAVVAGGVLRLAIGEGRGLAIRTDDPLVLRVEIAAARGAARTAAGGSPGGRNARGGATPDAPEG